MLPLDFGIQWLRRIVPFLKVLVFDSRSGCLAVVSEIRCGCFCRMFSMSLPRLSQYLPMQLYVTYTIEKASLTKIIVLHDVTSRVMVQADSLWYLTAETRVGVMARPCGNCGLPSGTETGFSPSNSIFPFFSLFHRAFWFVKFYSHQLMHFFILLCISLLSYIKIT